MQAPQQTHQQHPQMRAGQAAKPVTARVQRCPGKRQPAHLHHDGSTSIDHHGTKPSLPHKLPCLIVDLAGQLTRGTQHQGLGEGLAAAGRWALVAAKQAGVG